MVDEKDGAKLTEKLTKTCKRCGKKFDIFHLEYCVDCSKVDSNTIQEDDSYGYLEWIRERRGEIDE